MPTYVYRCRDCQKSVEVIQRFTDDPLTICPHCGGVLQRVLFAPAIIFKGSGWYSTDYKSPSGGTFAKPEEAAAETKAGGNGGDVEAIKPSGTAADSSKAEKSVAKPGPLAGSPGRSSERSAARAREKGPR
jgi:putative FmdB family regulatory protein